MTERAVRATIDAPGLGLTKGRTYRFLRWGADRRGRGPYVLLVNDRGKEVRVFQPTRALADLPKKEPDAGQDL